MGSEMCIRDSFVAVAALATLIDLFSYLGFMNLGFRWWSADIAALSFAAVFGVSAHRRFTLRNDPNLRWIHRPLAFTSSIAVAGAVDLLVLWTSDTRGLLAKVIAIAAAAFVRALSNRLFLFKVVRDEQRLGCLLYTSPSPRDLSTSRMPSSA